MSWRNPAYDGNVPRWTVRCGFVHGGVQCSVVGESAQNPEAPKAKKVKIFCPHHARQEGRTVNGRNAEDKRYVMCLSKEDKKRARAEQKTIGRQKKKKLESPYMARRHTVKALLGTVAFQECSVFHREMILAELRVPPLLLGTRKDPTRVYLMNDFSLDDLKYLFEKRADGRMLYLVRGSSIIRCDIISFVGHAWFIFQKH